MTPPEPYIVRVPPGKANEVVALFRRAPTTKLNNSNLANSAAGEMWLTISNRTSVSVAKTNYSRPTTPTASLAASTVRVVKAQAGDTVAQRYGTNATEVAKFNGLLPT